jgi:hypothetical protein
MPRKGQPRIAQNSKSRVYHKFYFVHLTEKNLSAPFLDALKFRPSRTTQKNKVFNPIKCIC